MRDKWPQLVIQTCTKRARLLNCMCCDTLQAPESYVPPSSHVFRDRLLDEAYKDVQARLADIYAEIAVSGCSIISDGLSDIQGNPLINILAHTAKGVLHISTVNTTGLITVISCSCSMFRLVLFQESARPDNTLLMLSQRQLRRLDRRM